MNPTLPSRVPDTVEALYELWSSTAAVTELALVWLGPVLTGEYGDALHVGHDGHPYSEFQAVTQDSDWAGLGTRSRDERFVVHCAVTALIGEADADAPRVAMRRGKAILAAAETVLRADPSLGQTPPPFTAAIVAVQLFIEPCPAGTQVRIPFDVGVKTRI